MVLLQDSDRLLDILRTKSRIDGSASFAHDGLTAEIVKLQDDLGIMMVGVFLSQHCLNPRVFRR
jgi:hypothetical protein